MSEILVDKQKLEELRNDFATTSVNLNMACVAARSAEYVGHSRDVKTIDSNNNRVCKKVDDLTVILDTIVEGFSTTDEKLKKKADELGNEYIGSEYYPTISNGGTVTVKPDGSYTIGSSYSQSVNDYINSHIDELLGINGSNVTATIGRSGDWCDAYVDYIIRISGGVSPGNTIADSTELFAKYHLRHGYDNGFDWNRFPYDNLSNDGYKPRPGDLVWVCWGPNLETQHVGIYYEDSDGVGRVLNGNTGSNNWWDSKSNNPTLDDFTKYALHVSFGDMTTFNDMVSEGKIDEFK